MRDSGVDEIFSREVGYSKRYFLDLAPSSSILLAVVCGGYEECSADYRVARDSFPYYVLEWVRHGEGVVRLGGRRHEVGPGSLFSYGPGVKQEICSSPNKPLKKHFVSFAGSDSCRLLRQAGLAPGSVSASPAGLDLPWVFDALTRDALRGGAVAARVCESLLRYLLAKLEAAPSNRSGRQAVAYETFTRCEEHLRQYAVRITSLAAYASETGLSEAYLCRLYGRFADQTPYQRLTWRRMNLAAEELTKSDRPIRAVSEWLGFADPFHFSRVFKKVFGVSPSEFRRHQ